MLQIEEIHCLSPQSQTLSRYIANNLFLFFLNFFFKCSLDTMPSHGPRQYTHDREASRWRENHEN